jgi:hypothetical protein
MPTQEQASTELKHISLLRKALIGKVGLAIDFEGWDWRGRIVLFDGMIDANDDAMSCLTNIFSKPVFKFSWQPVLSPVAHPLEPKLAFYRALTGMRLDEKHLLNYKSVFSKLPPVRVKAGTLFRLNMEDMKHYKMLYHIGLAEQGAQISEYLNVSDNALLLRRVRIVLTCYCLGQFVPVANAPKKETSKMSMASRILSRLRRAA